MQDMIDIPYMDVRRQFKASYFGSAQHTAFHFSFFILHLKKHLPRSPRKGAYFTNSESIIPVFLLHAQSKSADQCCTITLRLITDWFVLMAS